MLWLGGTELGSPVAALVGSRNIDFQHFTKAFRPRTSLSFPSAAPQCPPGTLLSLCSSDSQHNVLCFILAPYSSQKTQSPLSLTAH